MSFINVLYGFVQQVLGVVPAEKVFQVDTDGTLTSGQTAYYKVDTGFTDFLGNFDVATTGVTYVTGKVGDSADFNGTTSEGNTSDLFTFGSAGSISFWLRMNSSSASEQVMDGGTGTSVFNSSGINCQVNSGTFYIALRKDNVGGFINAGAVSTGVWYHIIYTWNGASRALYTNNVADGTGTETDFGDFTTRQIYGRKIDGTNDGDFTIDEISYWDRVLTAQERTDLYNDGLGQTMLIKDLQLPVPNPTAWYADLVNGQSYRTALINGKAITQWTDLSDNGYDLDGVVGTPIYDNVDNAINIGTGDLIGSLTNGSLTGQTGSTIFTVFKNNASDGSDLTDTIYPFFGNFDIDYYYFSNRQNANSININGGGTQRIYIGSELEQNETGLFTQINNGNVVTDYILRKDGSEQTPSSVGSGSFPSPIQNKISFGGYINNSGFVAWRDTKDIDVFETIIYDRILTAQEIEDTEQYLAIKYGLNAPVSPDKISGLTAWYGDEVNSGVDRTTLSDGTAITQWDDMSSNDWHLTGTTGNYPHYATSNNSIRTLGVATGDNEYLYNKEMNSLTGGTNSTIFMVSKKLTTDAYNRFWNLGWFGSDGYNYFSDLGGGTELWTASSGGRRVWNPNLVTNDHTILTYFNTGTTVGDLTIRRDGVAMTLDNQTGTGTVINTQKGFIISNTFLDSSQTPSTSWNSSYDWQEIIMYDRELSTVETQQVEAYLNNKYSIY